MADWFAFVLAIGEEFLVWLSSMSLLGTSLGGLIVGFFIIGVLFKILYKP